MIIALRDGYSDFDGRLQNAKENNFSYDQKNYNYNGEKHQHKTAIQTLYKLTKSQKRN